MKPNRAELKMLAPQLSSASSLKEVVTAGRSLLPAVQVLVVSLGKEGALLITSEGDWHALCPLPPESVRSTVGCGDALVAGFLAGIHQNRPLPECLRLGVACGSACALTVVAGLIHRPDVERLLAETRLSRL
jgi:fructose-1-phosphate kinase PfkB-like protein